MTKPSLVFAEENNVETMKSGLKELNVNVPIFVFGHSGEGYQSVNDFFVEVMDENEFHVTIIDSPNNHLGLIICPSGTSAKPKCIDHSNAAMLNNMDVGYSIC